MFQIEYLCHLIYQSYSFDHITIMSSKKFDNDLSKEKKLVTKIQNKLSNFL